MIKKKREKNKYKKLKKKVWPSPEIKRHPTPEKKDRLSPYPLYVLQVFFFIPFRPRFFPSAVS